MCSAACASSRFLPSEAYGGSFPTTPIPGCMSYWISWALITGCTHGLQVRASSERLEGRRLKKNQRTPPARGAKWWCEHGLEEVVGERSCKQVGQRGGNASNHPAHGEDPSLHVRCNLPLADGSCAGADDRHRDQEQGRGRAD